MKTGIVKPRTLSGFMELLPKEQLVFDQIRHTLSEVYRQYGFLPLDTPVLEHSEILLTKSGGETEKQIYRFSKGDTDLTMRFDLTVPLAKYVAKNYSALTFPFRRYQIGKVYRGERAQKGRFREFYQSDIDIIGDGSLALMNDAEIPSIIYDIFHRLGLNDFTIRINNRKVLTGFFSMLGLDEKAEGIMRVVDKLEKIGKDAVLKELEELGVSKEQCEKILHFISFKGSNEETIAFLNSLKEDNELFALGAEELEFVTTAIKAYGVPEENFHIDLTIARGLDYYTGTVYETSFNKHPEIGSICSGGRYENLAGYYTEKQLPGVGISIGLTRLFYILNERNYLRDDTCAPSDVLVIPMTEDVAPSIRIASELRKFDIHTQIYFEKKKFKAKIGYADKLSIPFAIFLGEDELAANKVALKNLSTGEQQVLPLEEAISVIKNTLSEKENATIIHTELTSVTHS